MRNQNRLREVGGEFLILLVQPLPEARRGLAQIFGIHLGQMSAGFEALVKLIGPQFSDGNPAQQLRQALFAELQKHA